MTAKEDHDAPAFPVWVKADATPEECDAAVARAQELERRAALARPQYATIGDLMDARQAERDRDQAAQRAMAAFLARGGGEGTLLGQRVIVTVEWPDGLPAGWDEKMLAAWADQLGGGTMAAGDSSAKSGGPGRGDNTGSGGSKNGPGSKPSSGKPSGK